jgi:hypothetical protein
MAPDRKILFRSFVRLRVQVYMTDALTEFARGHGLLSCHRHNPNILDMLHNLEEEFEQKARDIEREKRHHGNKEPSQQEGESLRASSGPWLS